MAQTVVINGIFSKILECGNLKVKCNWMNYAYAENQAETIVTYL